MGDLAATLSKESGNEEQMNGRYTERVNASNLLMEIGSMQIGE